ncbi:hypothetical protein [Croceicoccus sp. Ery15]|uniref:hypothetical protein n=1 Tax=Croceicoccus sp. Ery15 TaxID=1703338 RepID=UPI001E602DFD|nr:hypothetical protein [Croceicoccus sp. Ery15]
MKLFFFVRKNGQLAAQKKGNEAYNFLRGVVTLLAHFNPTTSVFWRHRFARRGLFGLISEVSGVA